MVSNLRGCILGCLDGKKAPRRRRGAAAASSARHKFISACMAKLKTNPEFSLDRFKDGAEAARARFRSCSAQYSQQKTRDVPALPESTTVAETVVIRRKKRSSPKKAKGEQ